MVKDLVNVMVTRMPIEPLARAVYGWVSAAARYDALIRQVLDRILRPNSNCVDVGCGRGQFLFETQRLAPQGRHLAIEPDPERFARLKARFPRAMLFNVAASDQTGDGTCQPAPPLAIERLLPGRCSAKREPSPYRVLTSRLDDLVPQDLAVRFLRINVRGREIPVLSGGLGLIRRCHPYLVFHFAPEPLDDAAAQAEEVYELLTKNGLAVSLLDDWLSGNSPIASRAFCSQVGNRQQTCFLAHP